jgi:hypothetical protein
MTDLEFREKLSAWIKTQPFEELGKQGVRLGPAAQEELDRAMKEWLNEDYENKIQAWREHALKIAEKLRKENNEKRNKN